MGDGPGSEATALLAELAAYPGLEGIEPGINLERRALPFMGWHGWAR